MILREPKILIFDIETSLQEVTMRGFFSSTRYPITVNPKDIKEPQKVHCIGYKWLGEKKSHVISVHDFKKSFNKDHLDDSRVIKEFCKILKDADAVIGHNIKRYDIKHINSRIMLNGLEPLILPHPIDTLLMSRSSFNFSSHKLDELARYLKLPVRKSQMCREDWDKCFDGEVSAFRKMAKYCKQDIELTEAVYKALCPYVKNHPKISRLMGASNKQSKTLCPVCNSWDTVKQGTRGTSTGRKQLRKCKDCNKLFEGEILK